MDSKEQKLYQLMAEFSKLESLLSYNLETPSKSVEKIFYHEILPSGERRMIEGLELMELEELEKESAAPSVLPNGNKIVKEKVQFQKTQSLAETNLEIVRLVTQYLDNSKFQWNDPALLQAHLEEYEIILLKEIKNYKNLSKKNLIPKNYAQLVSISGRVLEYIRENKKRRSVRLHPLFFASFGSRKAFELFIYLFDCYYEGSKLSKRKLTNIWHYLNDKNDEFKILLTQLEYKNFIKENYNQSLTNFERVERYYTHDLIIIEELFRGFQSK